MAIQIQGWKKWQGRAIKEIVRKRIWRGMDLDSIVAMVYFRVVTYFDDDFTDFARRVGGRGAESFFVRALQYLAARGSRDGIIDVGRERWGSVILSREYDRVSAKIGRRVHDALLKSTLAVKVDSQMLKVARRPRTEKKPVRGQATATSADADADMSRPILHERDTRLREDPPPSSSLNLTSPPLSQTKGPGGGSKGTGGKSGGSSEGKKRPCCDGQGAIRKGGKIISTCYQCEAGHIRRQSLKADTEAEELRRASRGRDD